MANLRIFGLASVREHVVLQPITAVPTDAGIEVRDDQRSALADVQRARGINQMLLAGVSPARVAKILRTKASRSSQMDSASVVSARRLL